MTAPNNGSPKGFGREAAQPCTPSLSCPLLGPRTSQSGRPASLLLMPWHPSPGCTGHGEFSASFRGGRLCLQLILSLSYAGVWVLLPKSPPGTARSGKGKCVSALSSCLRAGCLNLSPFPSEEFSEGLGVVGTGCKLLLWEDSATGKLSDIAAANPLATEMRRSCLPFACHETGLFPGAMMLR